MKLILRSCLACVLVGLLSSTAHAGANKVYKPYWAWNNNFNSSNVSISFGTGTTPQWTASFNFSSNNLYGYPASIRGWHYGWNPAGDTLFPRQVSACKSIPCSFSFNAGGTVSGDFAYDCFLRKDNQKSSPQMEVMVWSRNNSYPIGTRIVSNVITENGVTYDLWYGNNSAAGYYVYSFIPVRSSVASSIPTGNGSANLDMKHFFDKLNGRANWSSSMYLDVVEAGFEIVKGNGWVSCTYFSCSAN